MKRAFDGNIIVQQDGVLMLIAFNITESIKPATVEDWQCTNTVREEKYAIFAFQRFSR